MTREGLSNLARVLPILTIALLASGAAEKPASLDLEHWRKAFARLDHASAPADNPTTPEKVKLGAALFEDTRLSGPGGVSCSSCHQSDLSFSHGLDRHTGLDSQPLDRHTPP